MKKRISILGWWLFLIAFCFGPMITGCDHEPEQTGQLMGQPPFRIVSLSPAITQMVHDLGCADELVGRTAYDDLADPALPVVGDVFNLDYETLLSLEPTHVLVQAGAKGVPARLQELAAEKDWIIWSAPLNRAKDVWVALMGDREGKVTGLWEILGVREPKSLIAEINARLDAIRQATADQPRRRVLLLVDTDPIMAAGPDTFLNDILEIAGGTNAWTDETVAYPTLDKETVLGLKADLVIVIKRSDQQLSTAPAALGIDREITEVKILNDSGALKPTTTLVRVAEQLQKLIAPSTNSP